jgi:hypothetical protein
MCLKQPHNGQAAASAAITAHDWGFEIACSDSPRPSTPEFRRFLPSYPHDLWSKLLISH